SQLLSLSSLINRLLKGFLSTISCQFCNKSINEYLCIKGSPKEEWHRFIGVEVVHYILYMNVKFNLFLTLPVSIIGTTFP
ncbi:hypothetical protein ACRTDU_20760, partial [Sunxiuqinia elliptica]